MSEKQIDDYEKLQKEYEGNEFFEEMKNTNLSFNQLFDLLLQKEYKIVKYDYNIEAELKKLKRKYKKLIKELDLALASIVSQRDAKLVEDVLKKYK